MGNPSHALTRVMNAQLPQVFLLLHTFLNDFEDEIVIMHHIHLHISELVVAVSIWIVTSIKFLLNLVTFCCLYSNRGIKPWFHQQLFPFEGNKVTLLVSIHLYSRP